LEQTVAEMANEVRLRQAKARADRNGEPIEAAMRAVVGTEAGKQLADLRDGPRGARASRSGRRVSPRSGRRSSAGASTRRSPSTPPTVD
jgi:hypothetical protein